MFTDDAYDVAPYGVRGLKLGMTHDGAKAQSRTLRGAWIETSNAKADCINRKSRTLRGAWIETYFFCVFSRSEEVAPYGVRGLKHRIIIIIKFNVCRTLRGAWIETILCDKSLYDFAVAPYGVRGLKHF